MDKVILIRYGEIHLKGKNRRFFENKLIENIKNKLSGIEHEFTYKRSRYVVSNYRPEMEKEVVKRLKTVFGIHSISIAHLANSTIEDITAKAIEVCKKQGVVPCYR